MNLLFRDVLKSEINSWLSPRNIIGSIIISLTKIYTHDYEVDIGKKIVSCGKLNTVSIIDTYSGKTKWPNTNPKFGTNSFKVTTALNLKF